jgi:hypothetical protein
VELAKHILMSGGLILAVGTVAGLFAQKTKIPDVAVFLVAGMLIGPQVFDLIDIKADSTLYQILLLFGASYILFDGGASLRFHVMKQVWITIVVIATIGGPDYRADHHRGCASGPWGTVDSSGAAGHDTAVDRFRHSGADFPAGSYSRPRSANGDERVYI